MPADTNPFGLSAEQIAEGKRQDDLHKASIKQSLIKSMGPRDAWGKLINPDAKPRVKKVLGPDERDWNEQDFQREFDKWFVKNRHLFPSCLIELKATTSDSIPFDSIRPMQHRSLLACNTDEGVYHRIESNPNAQQSEKPSDSMYVRNVRGYVAVMFHVKQRGNKTFYVIPYESWVSESEETTRKSLTEDRAGDIGRRCSLM